MPADSRSTARRLAVEAVVIVCSILLAFGIEAWWENRGEDERRIALLQGLASDFEVAQLRYDTVMMAHNAVFQAADRWMDLSRGERPSTGLVELADSLVSDMFWTLTYQPPRGSVEALVAGGDMAVLENPRLAAALTSWVALVDRLNEWEQVGAVNFDRDFAPFLRESGIPVADLTWYPWNVPRSVEPRHTQVHRLLDSTEWESLVHARWANYQDALAFGAPVGAKMDTIAELIRADLQN